MSQYGKNEYWEDRYTKYFSTETGIQNPSIGTNATADSRTSSPPTSINQTECSTLEQATLDSAKKCSKKVTPQSQTSTTRMSASKQWRKSIKIKGIASNTC